MTLKQFLDIRSYWEIVPPAIAFIFIIFFPALIGGCVGGHIANSEDNVSKEQLRDYATAVSSRLERVEFGLSLLAIPVQRKE